MADYSGAFVWAEYSAPWCSACTPQANETKKAEHEFQGEVNFITIMTGQSSKYNDHATVANAKAWAKRFKLNPQHVLAAELWYKTVPEHRLYSPQGHTLFVHVGSLSASQIRIVIDYYKPSWEQWSESGTPADWMNF